MATPPKWLQTLADRVAEHIAPVDVLSPLGCHFAKDGERWEVTIFASATEVVGGERDGSSRPSRFLLDVLGIQKLFASVSELLWQPLRVGSRDDLGAHLTLLGLYEGHEVWLRVLARAPRTMESGRQARVYELVWTERW